MLADQPLTVSQRLIDKRQRRLGARPVLGDYLGMDRPEPRRVPHPRDRGDVIGLPGQPLARLPALLLGRAIEMPGLAREIVEDHVRLQDRKSPMPQ
jgi:hypothetical protein